MSKAIMSSAPDPTRTISVILRKAGWGKTTLVCISPMIGKVRPPGSDFGRRSRLGNVDIMFGPAHALENVPCLLDNQCSLEEVMSKSPSGFSIPGGSGVYGLSRHAIRCKNIGFSDQVRSLNRGLTICSSDTAPGIDDNVLYLNSAAQEIMVVVTPDPPV